MESLTLGKNKWNSTSKYVNFIPGHPIHIEFDFENVDMDKTFFFVRERINGVWEPGSERDYLILNADGHYELDIDPQGDYLQIYFEKGNSTDDGTFTSIKVDNILITQHILEIIEEHNYYPFGLKHKGYNNVVSANSNSVARKFQYMGKELNDELGLDWYDFGARNYDASLGRWMNIDPMAEEMRRFSPYTYAFNNPIYFIDPDGMMPIGLGQMDEKKNFYFSNLDDPNYIASTIVEASTVVDDIGKIIDYKDDGDPGIYLNERGEENLIGYETEGREYNVGDHVYGDEIFENAELPNGFIVNIPPEWLEPTILELPWYLGNPAGAFKNVKLLGYFARLKVLFNGGTAKITVQILANVDKNSNLIKLLRTAEVQAKSASAKKLVIEGIEILNKDLIGPKALKVFERLGYTVESVTDTTIKIIKNL